MRKFLLLAFLTALTACGPGTAIHNMGGSGGYSGGESQAESKAKSGELNPGETTGGDTQGGTSDDGTDSGISAISG